MLTPQQEYFVKIEELRVLLKIEQDKNKTLRKLFDQRKWIVNKYFMTCDQKLIPLDKLIESLIKTLK